MADQNGFQELTAHYIRALKPRYGPYPFCGQDGKLLKRLLRNYGLAMSKAIVDVFKSDCSSWTRMNLGLGWKGLQHELPKILDNSLLKVRAQKYEQEVSKPVADLINKIQLKPVVEGANVPKGLDGVAGGSSG